MSDDNQRTALIVEPVEAVPQQPQAPQALQTAEEPDAPQAPQQTKGDAEVFVIEDSDADEEHQGPVIKVVGVGGGGCNAVQHMAEKKLYGVDFIAMNTDKQALRKIDVEAKITIGWAITGGMGAGAKPDVGRQAALEDADRIKDLLNGANMVFIAAGMGGGTGTGAAPEVARLAKEMGVLVVAVVTMPFTSECREEDAKAGLDALMEQVDSAIVIANDNLLEHSPEKCTVLNAFGAADDVLFGAVEGIADIILKPGRINTDFADVRTVMGAKGLALMGSGCASGEDRAKQATEDAISCPLLDGVDIQGARGILVNVTSGPSLTMPEMEEILTMVRERAAPNAEIIRGWVLEPEEMDDDEVKVTIVATGLGGKRPTLVEHAGLTPSASPPDYEELDGPTVMRRQVAVGGGSEPFPDYGEDFLDLPTFLRRQAD